MERGGGAAGEGGCNAGATGSALAAVTAADEMLVGSGVGGCIAAGSGLTVVDVSVGLGAVAGLLVAVGAAGSGIETVATIGTAPNGTADWSTNRKATKPMPPATSTSAPSMRATRPFDGGRP